MMCDNAEGRNRKEFDKMFIGQRKDNLGKLSVGRICLDLIGVDWGLEK